MEEYNSVDLWNSVCFNNIGYVKKILATGFDVNTSLLGKTALYAVEEAGANLDIAHVLIEAGADVNVKSKSGCTLLHLFRRYEFAKNLIEAGADVDAKDNEGYTPLHMGTLMGNLDKVIFFIDEGADVNTINNLGSTPLLTAFPFFPAKDILKRTTEKEIIKVLLAAGADPNVKDHYGKIALHHAALQEDTEYVRMLIYAGTKLDSIDIYGQSPLDYAIESGNEKFEQMIHMYPIIFLVFCYKERNQQFLPSDILKEIANRM
jgi:ankyrin repeat protein